MTTVKMISQDTIYQFTVNDLEGNPIELSQYEGKVLLIVNTASQCVLTPQLGKLEKLYQQFHSQDFEILAFPSDDFLNQEPLEGEEIKYFCVNNFEVSFPIFDKMHVKGNKASNLYQFLSNRQVNGRVNTAPVWNFHKYLIDREGRVVDHFYSFVSPTSFWVKRSIRKLLKS